MSEQSELKQLAAEMAKWSSIRALAAELAKWVADAEEEFQAGGGEVWRPPEYAERIKARELIARAKAAGILP